MRRQRAMTASERFFWKNAGYSYDPKKETRAEGRRRCAVEMAEAEAIGQRIGLTFEWSDDWDIGSHKKFYGEDSCYADREPDSCEQCLCRDEHGDVVASLGCIDDADSNYRRVIEAESASEAIARLDREIETLDAH